MFLRIAAVVFVIDELAGPFLQGFFSFLVGAFVCSHLVTFPVSTRETLFSKK